MDFHKYIQLRRKAFDLVAEKSGKQMRYSSPVKGQPYWTHLMNVHNFLITKGVIDFETLLAAILHDVVEDYDVTIDNIKDTFSPKTSRIVHVMTKKKNWQHEEYFNAIINFEDTSAMQVKIADRIDNLLTHYCYWDEKIRSQRAIDEHQAYFVEMAKRVGWEKELSSAMKYFLKHKSLSQDELNNFVNNVSEDAVLE